ncbi:Hypothetical protein HVIM_02350 [Roseomonas mucosa]|uniref:Protein of uncharacterized function (DUF3293) n=1 Tax=Roseomonas mucosa TaxID=207340 RepID=A0A379N236_9PROT|nr:MULTISPECIES: DUF3293 domain-containing protein [Roseomonas]MBS5902225.1 DUF3293 domain-containing protein [Acetobacteraceae bacterium]AWV22821.1 Hypothetical protein RADP37_02350 [Roseomonas mucosa]MCG7351528.1 DUF3293 domain-containing protein [Roseomonas mucosa]MCG7356260.1 DUF3293 domain-containing protein [Roseomonas mucosa]MDT8274824.1 DUF3293 domain-containing protein [Roseomonas mucosa]
MNGGAVPARLRAAYRRARYEAGGVPVRIGRRSPRLDALLVRLGGHPCALAGGLVTAWNPLGRRLPEGRNRRRQERLERLIRHLPSLPARSGEGRWREEQRLLLADPRRLAVLGRRFRQNAVVLLARGRPARLLWLR